MFLLRDSSLLLAYIRSYGRKRTSFRNVFESFGCLRTSSCYISLGRIVCSPSSFHHNCPLSPVRWPKVRAETGNGAEGWTMCEKEKKGKNTARRVNKRQREDIRVVGAGSPSPGPVVFKGPPTRSPHRASPSIRNIVGGFFHRKNTRFVFPISEDLATLAGCLPTVQTRTDQNRKQPMIHIHRRVSSGQNAVWGRLKEAQNQHNGMWSQP